MSTTTQPLTRPELLDLAGRADVGTPATVTHGTITYQARLEHDPYTTPDDYPDVYGTFGWGTRDPDTGYDRRPAGMTGAARILTRGYPTHYWWQPPADVVTPSDVEALRRDVAELLEVGYRTVILERCEGRDAYGSPIVRDFAALSGCEGNEDRSYFADVLESLADELEQHDAAE